MKKNVCPLTKPMSSNSNNLPSFNIQQIIQMLQAQIDGTGSPLVPDTEEVSVRRAVLIGINYTGTSGQLNGCINDVNSMFMWLTKECGYSPADIMILTDDKSTDAGCRPTRANIMSALKWLIECTVGIQKGTKVKLFVHFSGHGSWITDKSGDEMDGRDETICPEDYAANGVIVDDELYKVLVEPIAAIESVQLSCLFDCCHSGTAMDLRYDVEIDRGGYTKDPTVRTYKVLQQKSKQQTKCQVVLLSGCLDNQTSADAYINRKSQGAMTWGFLETVRKFKGNLSFKRLLSQVQTRLMAAGYEQIPHLSFSRSVDLSEKMTF